MSIEAPERPLSEQETSPRAIMEKLASPALAETIYLDADNPIFEYKPSNYVPVDYLKKIEQIKNAPSNEIDDTLSEMVYLAERFVSEHETEEIPKVIVDQIHDTGEHLAKWNTEQHTIKSVLALRDAAALTGDTALYDIAIDIARRKEAENKLSSDIVTAIETAEPGDDFNQVLRHVEATNDRKDPERVVKEENNVIAEAPQPTLMGQRKQFDDGDSIGDYIARPLSEQEKISHGITADQSIASEPDTLAEYANKL